MDLGPWPELHRGQRACAPDAHGLLPTSQKRPSAIVARHEGELTVAEAAARLNLPEGTIYCWLHKQRLPARRVTAGWHTLWLLRLEDAERLTSERSPGGRLPAASSGTRTEPGPRRLTQS